MVLTDEEKKAKKKAEQLAKLEAQAEAIKQQKKDELVREIAAHSVIRKELDKKWRDVMFRIKEPVFIKETKLMWQAFERNLDKKNHFINIITHSKHVADNQYQRTVCSFCDIVDNILKDFLADMIVMRKQNDEKSAKLLKQGKGELNNLSEINKKAETHLQLLLYDAHETADSFAWTMRGENMVKTEEHASKYFEMREDLRYFLENNYTAMWDQYKASLKTYIVSTIGNQKQVRKLRRKQNTMADIIAAQAKDVINNEAVIRRLRAELASYESGTKQSAFRARRARHRNACNQLKTYFNNGVDTDVKQLARLVKASEDSVDWLDAATKKVEKILRIAALCRKFETLNEKILPYGTMIMPNTATEAKTSLRSPYFEGSISSTSALTRLWQRISRAELSKKALYREKMMLERENADMMRKLEMRNEENVRPKACKYPCVQKSFRRPLLTQPHAVDGSLEFKKVIAPSGLSGQKNETQKTILTNVVLEIFQKL